MWTYGEKTNIYQSSDLLDLTPSNHTLKSKTKPYRDCTWISFTDESQDQWEGYHMFHAFTKASDEHDWPLSIIIAKLWTEPTGRCQHIFSTGDVQSCVHLTWTPTTCQQEGKNSARELVFHHTRMWCCTNFVTAPKVTCILVVDQHIFSTS